MAKLRNPKSSSVNPAQKPRIRSDTSWLKFQNLDFEMIWKWSRCKRDGGGSVNFNNSYGNCTLCTSKLYEAEPNHAYNARRHHCLFSPTPGCSSSHDVRELTLNRAGLDGIRGDNRRLNRSRPCSGSDVGLQGLRGLRRRLRGDHRAR